MPHHYAITTTWIGNLGEGTKDYRSYSRSHEIMAAGKQGAIPGSSDPAFRGDAERYNPEELLVASLSSCHMLWALHLCSDAGIVVTGYRDEAEGEVRLNSDGSGEFTRVLLRPRMTIMDAARIDDAIQLHDCAHEKCFIARSVSFPVHCEPLVVIG
jgi:organic hydroperoxide reductase OsmC/OhrA